MDLGGSDHLNGSDGINWISYKNALKCYPKYSKSKFTFEIQIEINMFYLRSLTSAIKIQLYNSQMSGNRRQLYNNWRNLLSDKDQQYPVRESIIWGIFII